jgi:hypothetical protein
VDLFSKINFRMNFEPQNDFKFNFSNYFHHHFGVWKLFAFWIFMLLSMLLCEFQR